MGVTGKAARSCGQAMERRLRSRNRRRGQIHGRQPSPTPSAFSLMAMAVLSSSSHEIIQDTHKVFDEMPELWIKFEDKGLVSGRIWQRAQMDPSN